MKARITRMVSKFPDGHFIQWTIDGANESGNYVSSLFRSGGPDGPWELVAADLTNTYAYFDQFQNVPSAGSTVYLRPNQLRLFRNFYYKVEIITPSNTKLSAQDEVGPTLHNAKQEGVRRKLIRDLKIQLRKYNGTPVALLKRKVWGQICVDCTDKVTRETTRAACQTCWGTRIVGGYWTPTLVYARRGPPDSSTAITPRGKSDVNEVKIWVPDVPALERDDLIVFLEDQRRYRIDRQMQTEMQLVAVHQVFIAQEIDHSNIIYRMPIDASTLSSLI